MAKRDLEIGRDRIGIYEHVLPGGWTVWAGRTDADNDLLSTKATASDDWWFHVRGMSGSHVVLRAKPGEEPGREVLKAAAAIAAWYSKARGGGITPVSFTQGKYVRKPKSVKAGTVEIRKESVLKVRPALPTLDSPEEK
jgi:predicted ribosome quality control (RQC) complex YloA/Tae2 family protein